MIISILSDLNEIVSGIDSAKTPVAYATGPDIMIDLYISKLIETGHYSQAHLHGNARPQGRLISAGYPQRKVSTPSKNHIGAMNSRPIRTRLNRTTRNPFIVILLG